MKKKISLGQFYTPSGIATAIVNGAIEFLGYKPGSVIELAAGEGHLLAALVAIIDRDCHIHAVDIDEYNANMLMNSNPQYKVHLADSTKPLDFLKGIRFDLALGNPPFLNNVVIDLYIKDLLRAYLGIECSLGKKIRAEYIFICHYMSLLKEKGVLAIIVPESIVSGLKSAFFRKALFEKWKIEEVIELPGSPFSSTEAKTHILYIRKTKNNQEKIKVSSMGSDNLKSSIFVNKDLLIERMDFSFFSNKNREKTRNTKLSDCASITRGAKTHNFLKFNCKNYIHSTTFMRDFKLPEINESPENCVDDGDLIMCRVGSRVAGKTRLYKGNAVMFSDCIYRIRFNNDKLREQFMSYISTKEGELSLSTLARGVCSRYITKSDLSNFYF